MKNLLLALLALTFSTFNLLADEIRHLNPNEAPAPWRASGQLDFNRYGDHLFGYATKMEASNGKRFLEIRFSNGTKTKYSFGANVQCVDSEGEVTAQFLYERTAGYTIAGGSVEKSGELHIDCTKDTSLRIGWAISRNDSISLDDIKVIGKSILINELLGGTDFFN